MFGADPLSTRVQFGKDVSSKLGHRHFHIPRRMNALDHPDLKPLKDFETWCLSHMNEHMKVRLKGKHARGLSVLETGDSTEIRSSSGRTIVHRDNDRGRLNSFALCMP